MFGVAASGSDHLLQLQDQVTSTADASYIQPPIIQSNSSQHPAGSPLQPIQPSEASAPLSANVQARHTTFALN